MLSVEPSERISETVRTEQHHRLAGRRGAAVVASVVLALLLVGSLAPAAAHDWTVDDSCASQGGSYYILDGPSSGWYYHNSPCHHYVYSKSTSIIFKANWYLPVNNSNYVHTYDVDWKKRDSSHFTSDNVWYRRYCCGTSGGVTEHYWIDQGSASVGFNSLDGSASFEENGYIQMYDFTGSWGDWIGMDEVRWLD